MSNDSEASRLNAYQIAVGLYMNENSLTWERFNIMVTVNGLLVAAAQFVVPLVSKFPFVGFLLPVFGLFFCWNWNRMMARGFKYHEHWRKEAEELEKKLGSDNFYVLQKATTDLRRPGDKKAQDHARFLIILFFLLYVVSLLQGIWVFWSEWK